MTQPRIICGTSHPQLSSLIAERLGLQLTNREIKKFKNLAKIDIPSTMAKKEDKWYVKVTLSTPYVRNNKDNILTKIMPFTL